MNREEIIGYLKEVLHPGKGDKNIVELGMVSGIEIDGEAVSVTLAFPKRRDPLTEYLVGSAFPKLPPGHSCECADHSERRGAAREKGSEHQ